MKFLVEARLDRKESDLAGLRVGLERTRVPSVQVSRELVEDENQCEGRPGLSAPFVEITTKRPIWEGAKESLDRSIKGVALDKPRLLTRSDGIRRIERVSEPEAEDFSRAGTHVLVGDA